MLLLRHRQLLTSDLELVLITVHRKLDSHWSCSPGGHTLAAGSCAALV